MGTPREPKPAKFFVALLSSHTDLLPTVEKDLSNILGAVDARSEVWPWTVSNFYEKEMGSDLRRRFLSFEPLASPGELARIKLLTQQVEDMYRDPSTRAPALAGGSCSGFRPTGVLEVATGSPVGLHKSADHPGRRVNIDPGYIDAFKVALASTKNAGQRIYLHSGIHAEATLQYFDGAFHGLAYTYPDYLWPATLAFFTSLRSAYLDQLRRLGYA
jgi:hypothetical protein